MRIPEEVFEMREEGEMTSELTSTGGKGAKRKRANERDVRGKTCGDPSLVWFGRTRAYSHRRETVRV